MQNVTDVADIALTNIADIANIAVTDIIIGARFIKRVIQYLQSAQYLMTGAQYLMTGAKCEYFWCPVYNTYYS